MRYGMDAPSDQSALVLRITQALAAETSFFDLLAEAFVLLLSLGRRDAEAVGEAWSETGASAGKKAYRRRSLVGIAA